MIARHKRAKSPSRIGIDRSTDHAAGPSVEISGSKNDLAPIYGDRFPVVAPLPADFYRCFYPFRTGIHGEYLVVYKQIGDVLGVRSQLIANS